MATPSKPNVNKKPLPEDEGQAQQPKTFAQMQQQGFARPPAPQPNIVPPAPQPGLPQQPPAQRPQPNFGGPQGPNIGPGMPQQPQGFEIHGGMTGGPNVHPPAPGMMQPPNPGQQPGGGGGSNPFIPGSNPGAWGIEQQLMHNYYNTQPGGNFQHDGGQLGQQTQQSLMQALQNPSAYNSDVVMGTYNQMNQGLSQGFDIQRQKLNEEMARRGLGSSTIFGGRYSDLGTEQARAQTGLAQGLLDNQARTYGQDRASALGQAIGYGGQQFDQGLAAHQSNVNQNAQSLQQLLGYGQQSFDNQMDQADFNSNQDYRNMQLYLQMMGMT